MGFGFIHFKLQQFSKWFDHSIPVSNVPNLSNENVVHSVLFCFSVFHYRKLLIGTLSKRILSNPMNWLECRIQHKIHTYIHVGCVSIHFLDFDIDGQVIHANKMVHVTMDAHCRIQYCIRLQQS